MSQLQFIPLPDPRFPETLTPENIATLQAWGVIPQGVSAYASRTHWGSTPGTHGLFPEEGTTPKYWTDRQPDAGGGYLFRVGETEVFRSNTEPAGFSHPVFEIYGQHTAQFYRDYAPLFEGRIPVLVEGSVPKEEANRFNVKAGEPMPYPFGRPRPDTPTGWSFPTDCALRFRPGTQIVEAFKTEAFTAHFGDAAQYDKPVGVMAPPPAPAPVAPPPPVTVQPVAPPPATVPPAPPAPPAPTGGTATYEGMEQDLATGEAAVNGIWTGWTFERVMQVVPIPGNAETGRMDVRVNPWGFATASTAQRVLELLQVHTHLPLEIFKGDQNDQFPMSAVQRYIGVQGQPRRVAVNAGLIASAIARTTAEVDNGMGGKKIVQNDRLVIAEALASLNNAIE